MNFPIPFKNLFWISFLLVSINQMPLAQSGKVKSLTKGNRGIYLRVENSLLKSYEYYEVVNDTIIFDKNFAIINQYRNKKFIQTLYERVDSTCSYAFTLSDLSESILCDFNAEVADSLSEYEVNYMYTDHHGGQNSKFVRLYYEFLHLDWIKVINAEGIGWIYLVSDGLAHGHFSYTLIGAILNNVVYGDTVITTIEALARKKDFPHFQLIQKYPNPFNIATNLQFALPQPSEVKLEIYDLRGKLITSIINSYELPSIKKIYWEPKSQNSGVYFYYLLAKSKNGQIKKAGKMLYLK